MGKLSQRFRIFKQIYKELDCTKKMDITKEDMKNYKEEVEKNIDSFMNCELGSIRNINILESLTKVNWNLLHNMYFASVDKRDEELVQKSKNARNSVEQDPPVPVLPTPSASPHFDLTSILSSPMFTQVINSVLPSVQKAFEGKDLQNMNMAELVQGIMTRDPEKCGGVDVTALIEESVSKLKEAQ